jgi:glycosyltransferase involved in cell wall biosynthesis
MVNSMGLEKDVVLLDWVPEAEMNSLYFNALAVIVPSHTESYLPMLQALNFGKPLLISEIPPHKEIAGEKAFYFDSNSPTSIADAILSYLKVSKAMSGESQKELSVKDNYSWKNTAIQTLSLMKSIIN